jgi:hypothetical protein
VTIKHISILKWFTDHYGCADGVNGGVPLENGGGKGASLSHWDRYFLGNDIVRI